MTILYIHGFASTGNSGKVTQLRAIFPNEEVIAPTLSHRPMADFKHLMRIVQDRHVTTVVASSLGGFYALALAQKYDLRLVLLNPSVKPYETLAKRVGSVRNHDTGDVFDWTDQDVFDLTGIGTTVTDALDTASASAVTWKNVLVLLGEKDDVIDPHVTATLLPRATCVFDANADHRFADIYGYADMIRRIASAPSDIGEPPLDE